MGMLAKQQCVEYLISTPVTCSCTNLAEHLARVSHDVVGDALQRERLTARHWWELVQGLLAILESTCQVAWEDALPGSQRLV